jgi:hypothetical protein
MSFEPHYINTYIIQLMCLFIIWNILFICIGKLYGLYSELNTSYMTNTRYNNIKTT